MYPPYYPVYYRVRVAKTHAFIQITNRVWSNKAWLKNSMANAVEQDGWGQGQKSRAWNAYVGCGHMAA